MRIPPPAPELDPAEWSDLWPLVATWLPEARARDRYLPWDEFRRRPTPEPFTSEQWWWVTSMTRWATARSVPLLDLGGQPFRFSLPDLILERVDSLSSRLGAPRLDEEPLAFSSATRDQYLIRSLMEESITSSQLEGAATTRKVAKDMLRQGRRPRDKGERMIANNYAAMQLIREHAGEPLSSDLVLALHRMLTEGTLEQSADAGRMQRPHEERVHVGDIEGNVLHAPPPAHELPDRMARLIDFANGGGEQWIPRLLRPIMVHFMLGHDHPFVDGNGRLARALFYHSMLREGFWLAEFLSISEMLLRAPAKYGRAYLHSEAESDLTYFLIFHLDLLEAAVDELEAYVARKSSDLRAMRARLQELRDRWNHRQIAVLNRAAVDPSVIFTVESHAASQGVSKPTAQTDLTQLAEAGFLLQSRVGRRFEWTPGPRLGTLSR